jgi:molybdenum cofactor cytidylyltransferase
MNRFKVLNNAGVLLLAAGQSRRFGSQKLMHPLKMDSKRDAMPMIGWTIENILKMTNQLVVVVDSTQMCLVDYLKGLKVETVLNDHAELGLGVSLSTGIHSVSERWQVTLVALGDMPFIETETYQTLLMQGRSDAITVPIVNEDQGPRKKRGNPVVFGRRFYPELSQLKVDQGGKEIIKRHSNRVLEIEVRDQGVLTDIDRPSDLVNLMLAGLQP